MESNHKVILSITYDDSTTDIVDCKVSDILDSADEVVEVMKKELRSLIKEKKRERETKAEPEPADSTSTKRTKSQNIQYIYQLEKLNDEITAWNPGKEYPKRRKAKILYVKLLKLLMKAANERFSNNIEDIVSRVLEYWQEPTPGIEERASSFMKEVHMLCREMGSLQRLKEETTKLVSEFKKM